MDCTRKSKKCRRRRGFQISVHINPHEINIGSVMNFQHNENNTQGRGRIYGGSGSIQNNPSTSTYTGVGYPVHPHTQSQQAGNDPPGSPRKIAVLQQELVQDLEIRKRDLQQELQKIEKEKARCSLELKQVEAKLKVLRN